MTEEAAADWYPDPFGRFEHRYWDGARWTDHAATGGVRTTDPVADPPPAKEEAGTVSGLPSETALFAQSRLLVKRRSRLVEVNAEYLALDSQGRQVGTLREVRQSLLKRATGISAFSTRRFHLLDHNGRPILVLRMPFTALRPKIELTTLDGIEVGQIVRWLGVLDEGFGLLSKGQKLGSVRDERGKLRDFVVRDRDESEVGRIKRKRVGGGYLLEVSDSIDHDLRVLVVAATLTLDIRVREMQAQEKIFNKRSGGGDDGGGGGDGGS